MLGPILELLTLFFVFGPFVFAFWFPLVPAQKGKLTRWELGSILFGLCSGPLLLAAIPRNAGFGAFYWLAIFDLVLPAWGIAIARTTRPFRFALIGSSGYFVAFVVLYFASPPSDGDMGPLLMIPTIFAYLAIPALVLAIPFYVRVRWYLKRNPDPC